MNRTILLAVALLAAPLAASAMPMVGDIVGTSAEEASAALEKAGCPATGFEAEDGAIEALCTDSATSAKFDVSIDPATGAILTIKESDD